MIVLHVRFALNIDGVVEEITDAVLTLLILEPQYAARGSSRRETV